MSSLLVSLCLCEVLFIFVRIFECGYNQYN